MAGPNAPVTSVAWASTTSNSAGDDYSRLAYSEIFNDEKGTTCAGFLTRAVACFASHGITANESSPTT